MLIVRVMLAFIAVVIALTGLIKLCIVYCENYKYVLTTWGEISLYWKPDALIIFGLLMLMFCASSSFGKTNASKKKI